MIVIAFRPKVQTERFPYSAAFGRFDHLVIHDIDCQPSQMTGGR